MMVSNGGNVVGLLRWQKQRSLAYLGLGSAAWLLHDVLGIAWFNLPGLPMAVVGGAIGIFVSFRTNSAYDRWWEGRKLWGRLINTSRHFGDQVIASIKDGARARELVVRHIAWVHTLRSLLRQQDPLHDPDALRQYDDTERAEIPGVQTPTAYLVHRQQLALTRLADEGELNEHRLESFDRTLMAMLDIQGGCERIKGTPLPRGYAFITEALVNYYAVLLPFALVETLGLLTIPINLLVCMSFHLISEAGRVLEDPFTVFWNGLPLSNLSIKVERDLRQRLGDTDIPPAVQVDRHGILM